MKDTNLIARGWEDYELIDSGEGRKLERYGTYTVIRPETQAIWKPTRTESWKSAQAEFSWAEGKGTWKNSRVPESWQIAWGDVRFTVRLTSFKHTGVFPEQACNWEWLKERVKNLEKPEVLNLFGYTGIASIVAAMEGARVTHVDASRQSNAWAKDNAALSGIPDGSIRYILDDAVKFVERDIRREAKYDGIILDPPAFGRGPKGEVWKIEEDLPRLLEGVKALLKTSKGSFLILNGYAAGYSPQSFRRAVETLFPDVSCESGELCIEENGGRMVSSGIYVRFVHE